EGVKTENDHINLKVAGQDGSVVQFKIKRHTPLSKLMKAYCERQGRGLSMRQIRFRFDGQPINETDTPAQVRKLRVCAWRWRTRTPSTCSSSRREARGTAAVAKGAASTRTVPTVSSALRLLL
uniref:Ubiquitin-like domain-containing protein n=1 Tax=Panthera tigris altaica TaxID=74533 RepID=A0A8C9MCF6_PANTA